MSVVLKPSVRKFKDLRDPYHTLQFLKAVNRTEKAAQVAQNAIAQASAEPSRPAAPDAATETQVPTVV